MKDLLDKLNDSQKAAVLYNEGPSLIIAGAGSGKTRVLTYKIAYLLERGLPPWNIMALTFTNKAAREMKERIATLIDPLAASRLWMGTFHSIFSRILRAESSALGFPTNFTIYDTSDSKNLVKTICKEKGLDDKTYKTNAVLSRISAAKNDLVSPEAYAGDAERVAQDIRSKMPQIKDIYVKYTERCRLSAAMDYDDLLYYTNVLFRDHPEILQTYQDRFNFLLVDEYQDTNFSQYLIVKKLAEKHHRVCVVGDDSQSIYSFRGANIDNILNFKTTYPEGKLFKLEQNYRSTQTIVNVANSLISKNKGQIPKRVFSKNEEGHKIQVLSACSDIEEGYFVASKINEIHLRTHDNFNRFAVLYRTNAQSRIFEESLRKRNIPYRVYGGLSFYQRKEIKDIIAYLRLILNPDDEEAFKRIVNYPARGIGDTTVQKIIHSASEHNISLWKVLEYPASYGVSIHSGTWKKLNAFQTLIESFRPLIQEKNVYNLTNQLLRESGILRSLDENTTPENLSRKENIQALQAGMYDFCQSRTEEDNPSIYLTDYLSEISLLTDQDESKNAEGERVTLMTIHAAKGLEFKNVFVAGLEEEIFPSSHSLASEKALEEERRLLYVAITRAESVCILSYAKNRFRNGKNNFTYPSRFIKELDSNLLDYPGETTSYSSLFPWSCKEENEATPRIHSIEKYERKTIQRFSDEKPYTDLPSSWTKKKLVRLPQTDKKTSTETKETHPEIAGLKVGGTILHERFGNGTVKALEGIGDNAKMEVDFENAGYRKLLIKFARFTIIE